MFFTAASIVLVALVIALTVGVTVWIAAVVAAVALVVVAAFRAPSELKPSRVPWATLVFAAGLFVVVETLHTPGITDLLVNALPCGTGTGSLLLLAGRARRPPTRSTTCPPTWRSSPQPATRPCATPRC